MKRIIVDADGAIVGRLGSYVAKELLKGNKVDVINSENAIFSGDKERVIEDILKMRARGGSSRKGPKIPALPDRLLKRKIRGMLPWNKPKGRIVYKKNLRCYAGSGGLREDEIKQAEKIAHKKPLKYVTIKQIINWIKS